MKYLFCLMLILSTPFMAHGQSASSRVITGREMEQVLADYLAGQSELLPQVALRFKSMLLPEAYSVPAGRIVHQVIPDKPGVIGSSRFTLLTRVDGRTVSNQSVRVEIEALADIAVVTAGLRRGTILTAADVELSYQDISRYKEPVFSLDEVVGKRLKRSVRLGAALQRHQIEFPPLIKRGERVMIEARGQGLTLTAGGEAKEDGRPGEAIRVMNSSSRKEVLCRVVAPGLVRVEF